MAVKVPEVRSGLYHDGPVWDGGIDCSVDPDTGEELFSLTKQSFAEDCDINTIMRRYQTTGTIDHVNRRQGEYGDFSSVASFQESLDIVLEAGQMFADLPASVRDRFGNDPANLLAFIADEANRDEAIKLGIVKAPEPAAPPQKVEIVNSPKPKGSSEPSGEAGTAST